MIGKVRHIHALTNIKRERVLPVPGTVLVRRMQKVIPTDVIVASPLSPQYIMLDIAQGLNVSTSRADELLQRQSGEELVQGDVIAGPVGLFQRVIRAPFPGQIRIAGEGKVLYEINTPDHELQAGLEGTVTNIIPDRGAIIETHGAFIQGVWGNGKIAYGVIQSVSNDLLQELVIEQLNISFRGTIITAGYCKDPEVLQAAATLPIKGLILGSMSADLIPRANSMEFPIMVIDGFGERPMNRAAENVLAANKDKNVALNTQMFDPFNGVFPEVVISHSGKTDSNLPQEAETLRPGKRVIIINGTEKNQVGTIETIHTNKQKLSNEIETYVAVVELANDRKASIPLTNLEILN